MKGFEEKCSSFTPGKSSYFGGSYFGIRKGKYLRSYLVGCKLYNVRGSDYLRKVCNKLGQSVKLERRIVGVSVRKNNESYEIIEN